MGRNVIALFTTIAAVLLYIKPAYAYLDPGAGSAILQGVLAALAAVALTLKLYWHRLLRFFGVRKGKSEQEISKSKDA